MLTGVHREARSWLTRVHNHFDGAGFLFRVEFQVTRPLRSFGILGQN